MTGNQYDLIVVGAGPVDMWLQYVQPSLLIQQLSKKHLGDLPELGLYPDQGFIEWS